MDPKISEMHSALRLVDPQIQLAVTRMVGRDQNNVGPKVYPIILRLGSPLSLNMARKTLNSLEDKAFQHGKPVDAGAVGVAVAPHVVDAFQYQAAVLQLGQILQEQFLNRVRQA